MEKFGIKSSEGRSREGGRGAWAGQGRKAITMVYTCRERTLNGSCTRALESGHAGENNADMILDRALKGEKKKEKWREIKHERKEEEE